jgi:hypothetical protein
MLLLAAAALAALPPSDATWTLLQSSPVRIECTTVAGKPWCRSTGVIGVPVAKAADTFEHLDAYVARMGAITLVERLEPNVLHIVMDYPFPLDDRDYVAKFGHRVETDGTQVYPWTSVESAAAPPTNGVVRLSWFEGEWRFADEGGHTRVTYVWEADPGGNLPDVKAVRTKAGFLAIQDMANACGTTIAGP